VLLASGERQHEPAASRMVGGLAGQAARHLPHELFARGDDADKRPAVARGQAEALPLHGHDIGLGRRPHDAERNRLGNGYDQQRLFGVGDLRELWYLLEDAEEVWRLHHHSGSSSLTAVRSAAASIWPVGV